MDELYGLFKKCVADNHYVSLAKGLNSAYATKHTGETLKRIENYCSHGSNLQIKDGICYLSYIRNTDAFNDDEFSPYLELVLASFSLERVLSEDFDIEKDVSRRVIGKIGTEFLGERATTCHKGNAMQFIGDELVICTCFCTEGGRYQLFRTVYDTELEEFTRPARVKLSYKGTLHDMDDATVNMIYSDAGVPLTEGSILEIVSPWNEYRGEYYSTFVIGSPTPNSGIVIKTRDFEVMEFVSVIPHNERGSAEAISCIYDGKLFVACRQSWTLPYMLLMRYDIDEGVWHAPYRIEDANSRPWMFVYKNELFLYNTIDEGYRQYSNISKIRTSKKAHNGKNNPIDTVATLYDCGAYSGFSVVGDRIFFACSKDGRVHFGELILKEHSPEAVGERFLELFGDVGEGRCDESIAIGAEKDSR